MTDSTQSWRWCSVWATALTVTLSALPPVADAATRTVTVRPSVHRPAAQEHARPVSVHKVAEVEGITEYLIGNGLRVLLFPDPSLPTLTVNITYFVGSRHEGFGEAGMAHLLEHMAFKGTPTYDDIWKQLEDHGAFFNGTTWVDRTNYFEILPASTENLAFALDMEADRMVNCKIDAGDLATEFTVVRNEFEAGENDPASILEQRMAAVAYEWHNYGKATIGPKSDIERVPVESLRAFYRRYYQPDNAMLVVAGKIDIDPAMVLIKKYFGAIPRPKRKLDSTYTVEPVQDGERTVVLRRVGDVGVVGVMYHGVSGAHEDFAAHEAIVDMLTSEPSGRLYKELVEKGLAASVDGDAYAWAEPGLIQFFAQVRKDASMETVRDRMVRTIEEFAAGSIRDDEVERFRAKSAKDMELAMTDSKRIAIELSEWGAIGDWRMMFIHRDRIKRLTPDKVRKAAAAYLKPGNRTVGMFIPTDRPDRSPLPDTVDVGSMVRDYVGQDSMTAGEVFASTVENIEKRCVRTTLKNGMKVAFIPKKTRGGAVKFILTIHAGSEKDLAGRTAVSALVPDMLPRGSKKHTFQEIRDLFDRHKANVSFESGDLGEATVRGKTVREHLPAVLALVAEILKEPAFPPKEFDILKKETLAALEENLQDPVQLGWRALVRNLNPWPKDNVRYVPTLQEEIDRVTAATISEVSKLHKNFWGASAAELTLMGDFDLKEMKAALERHFGAWRPAKPHQRIATPYRASRPSEEIIATPDKQMAGIGVGHAIEVRDGDPEYPALEMINYVLGSSAKSRLLERLRQKEGISYGAFSQIVADPVDQSGQFLAGAICAPQNADRAMQALMDELEKLVRHGIPAAELADSKKSYQQVFDNELAQDNFILYAINKGLYFNRTLDYHRAQNARIQALTPADIRATIDKHIRLDRLIKVRAGDFKK